MSTSHVIVRLDQVQDYQFDIHFDASMPLLRSDEPAPLGQGSGPSPVQLLAAAVGNCLSDSLLFALRKFKLDAGALQTEVAATVGRNAEGRMRVVLIEASLRMSQLPDKADLLARTLNQFEAFCTVTQTVAAAVPVHVRVFGPQGQQLHGPSLPEQGATQAEA